MYCNAPFIQTSSGTRYWLMSANKALLKTRFANAKKCDPGLLGYMVSMK